MRTGHLPPPKILIADGDGSQRLAIARTFAALGCQVRATPQAATLLKWIDDPELGLAVIDVGGPNDPAYEVVRDLRRRRPRVPVLVTLREAGLAATVQAIESGAFDALPKPYDLNDLVALARRAGAAPRDRDAAQAQARALRDDRAPLIGRSPAMQELYRATARLVSTDVPVLIQGETGTGKALVARALHDLSPRRDRAFVAMSLVSADAEALEADLLGRPTGGSGRLAEAEGGTLYLDSICDLSDAAQARLVRLLDALSPAAPLEAAARQRRPRIVAAAHHDLAARVRSGRFREDLYFRLNVAPLHVPALRARPEDIPDLAHAFLLRAGREGHGAKHLDGPALQRLRAHDWPGNVRELENLMRRIAALYPEPVIGQAAIERELSAAVVGGGAPQAASDGLSRAVERAVSTYFAEASRPAGGLHDHIIRAVEQSLFQAALLATRGNRIRAAEILGINRNTLRRKMEDLGVDGRAAPGVADLAAAVSAPAPLAA